MFVSRSKKGLTLIFCISSIQIVLIKDKIRSFKTLCIFCFVFLFCFIKPTIFINVFSDFNKMAEKRKFSDGKTFGRLKFLTETFSDKKNPKVFLSKSFRF